MSCPAPNSKDLLDGGCWAEHNDGSLLLVGRSQSERVDYWLFDMAGTPPTICRSALPKAKFEKMFADKGDFLWTWRHEQTPFPWDRILLAINGPWWRNTPLLPMAKVA
jgi:hypothetical protein